MNNIRFFSAKNKRQRKTKTCGRKFKKSAKTCYFHTVNFFMNGFGRIISNNDLKVYRFDKAFAEEFEIGFNSSGVGVVIFSNVDYFIFQTRISRIYF